ncbi:YybH family protein [Lentiprolixibacter aurantiacus]|uniref:Nuclear transport factor 2 family protein n=1 Tax=Lentiprolixibacter aurantiacus TaxID=2993939 RepID=A0AAE3MJK0_9FLAO|nr:nuclear transport factor 2 family protein [Lentiprolixibacter aurantiacus]MCX2718880.1 nuclear transport factor 2 family protein [Lentiprolixibacter aurantiacus]
MKKVIYYAIFVLLLAACSGEQKQVSEEDMAAQAEKESALALQAIEEINATVPALILEGKFEEAGKYFAPDVVQMISGQPPINSREAWIEAQRQAAAIGEWNLELEVLNFEYLGDRAVERGRGVQTFTANENSPMPSMQMTGDYLVMWKKTDEGWQIQYDYVVIAPPEAPME